MKAAAAAAGAVKHFQIGQEEAEEEEKEVGEGERGGVPGCIRTVPLIQFQFRFAG